MKNTALFKTIRVVVVLLISVSVAVVLVRMRPRAEKQEQPSEGRLVTVVSTRSQTLPMLIEAYGTISPRESLKLVAEVRGQVVAMHPAFIEGGFIPSGEVLLSIDPRDYELGVRQAKVGIRQAVAEHDRLEQEILNLKASLQLANADVELARAEVNRLKQLAVRDMTSQSVLDKADRQYLNSRERLQSLENQLAITGPDRVRLQSQIEMATVVMQQASLELERCQIEVPFHAWVTQKAVEIGQHLAIGQPVGQIYRAGAFDIEVKIPVGDLAWLPDDVDSGVGLPAMVVFAESNPPKQWLGRLARVKAALDPTTRTLPVVIEVDEPSPGRPTRLSADRLKPGMFVTINIQGRQVTNIHRLPRHLIRDGDTVFIAVEDQLSIRKVTILRRFKESVLISDGLSDGDLVIASPLSGAVSGMRIRLESEVGGQRTED